MLTPTPSDDARYLSLLIDPIRVCAKYKPKMGQGGGAGLTLEEFQALYQADPLYAWYGLDHPLMYAAHKAAGGMTSVYRQIGIGVEHLFNQIIRDQLGLTVAQAHWSYDVVGANLKTRTLTLDGRIDFNDVMDPAKRKRIQDWVKEAALELGVAPELQKILKGVVFEVRQGYKSKDSKRQNGDIANASTAYTQAYLPSCVVLSSQIDTDIVVRYRNEKWAILTGLIIQKSPHRSTFAFAKDVLGYDLADFFQRNSQILKEEVAKVLHALLSPKS
jgi:hypothetical protein